MSWFEQRTQLLTTYHYDFTTTKKEGGDTFLTYSQPAAEEEDNGHQSVCRWFHSIPSTHGTNGWANHPATGYMVKKVKYSFPHFSVFVGLWPYFHSRRCTNSGWLFLLLSRFFASSAAWLAGWNRSVARPVGVVVSWHIYRKRAHTDRHRSNVVRPSVRPGDVKRLLLLFLFFASLDSYARFLLLLFDMFVRVLNMCCST